MDYDQFPAKDVKLTAIEFQSYSRFEEDLNTKELTQVRIVWD